MLVSDKVTPCVSCLIILIAIILTDWADCVQYIEVSIALYYTSENIKVHVVSPTITTKSNQPIPCNQTSHVHRGSTLIT